MYGSDIIDYLVPYILIYDTGPVEGRLHLFLFTHAAIL